MDTVYIDWLGYFASFFVIISFVFKKIEHLRVVSAIGCALFVLYGYFIDAVPVMVTNLFIFIINLYFIFKGKLSYRNSQN